MHTEACRDPMARTMWPYAQEILGPHGRRHGGNLSSPCKIQPVCFMPHPTGQLSQKHKGGHMVGPHRTHTLQRRDSLVLIVQLKHPLIYRIIWFRYWLDTDNPILLSPPIMLSNWSLRMTLKYQGPRPTISIIGTISVHYQFGMVWYVTYLILK